MSKESRIALIKQIEEHRHSRVITYLTSYRPGLEVQMAMDAIRKIYDHLKTFTPTEAGKPSIDLFLVSNGGDGTVPWKLVTLIREYCSSFSALIPYRAFSAATLTSLGADKVVMHPMGMLGPTDPTVTNAFNPDNPTNPAQKLGISVEDVSAYIALIKEDLGVTHQEELIQAFNILANKIHPLSLGNVKRFSSQSKMMAQKLLSLHMNKAKDQHAINDIVENFTSKLYYHGHPINRIEAKEEIGLKTVEHADETTEKLMWELFLEYESELKSEIPFNPQMEIIAAYPSLAVKAEATINLDCKVSFIESTERTDYAQMKLNIWGQKQPNGTVIVVPNIIESGWRVE
jgi:Serine dehydrogenase proteinase